MQSTAQKSACIDIENGLENLEPRQKGRSGGIAPVNAKTVKKREIAYGKMRAGDVKLKNRFQSGRDVTVAILKSQPRGGLLASNPIIEASFENTAEVPNIKDSLKKEHITLTPQGTGQQKNQPQGKANSTFCNAVPGKTE